MSPKCHLLAKQCKLRDSPNNVFKDRRHFHACQITIPLANKTRLGRALKAAVAVPECSRINCLSAMIIK
ncbi:hypothetical protein TNCV_4874741 [Trichonephila clavipes]|nr:hypothetical protein TNCV_4874741 [Trichonephila clavipes]